MIPDNLKYGRHHSWIRVDGATATLGVTPYALKELGNLVTVELPDPGDDVLHEVPVAEIEGTRDVWVVYSLMDGVAIEINGNAAHDPDIIAKDPYNEGWLVRLQIGPESKQGDILTADEYKALLRRKK